MPPGRYPRAVWKGDGYSKGSYTGGPWKGIIHTTETVGVPSYNQGRSAPHITYDTRNRTFYQHTDFNRPARALRDTEGGIATNRDSVLQLEIVCYSDESVVDRYPNTGRLKVSELSPQHMDDIRDLLLWWAREFGIEWTYPKSNARWSVSAYDRYGGFMGHKHVPENTHWDPGALNHEALFIEEDDMEILSVDEQLQLQDWLRRLKGAGSNVAYISYLIPELKAGLVNSDELAQALASADVDVAVDVVIDEIVSRLED